MSDLIDISFYTSAERIWLNNAGKWTCDQLTDVDFGKKKVIFSGEAHFDLDGYVNEQNCLIWGIENLHAYIEKLMHPNRVTVWCAFWSEGIIGPFFCATQPKLHSMFCALFFKIVLFAAEVTRGIL